MIGLDQVGESVAFAVDFLVILVTFTGQYHDIVGTGAGDQLGNSRAATGIAAARLGLCLVPVGCPRRFQRLAAGAMKRRVR